MDGKNNYLIILFLKLLYYKYNFRSKYDAHDLLDKIKTAF